MTIESVDSNHMRERVREWLERAASAKGGGCERCERTPLDTSELVVVDPDARSNYWVQAAVRKSAAGSTLDEWQRLRVSDAAAKDGWELADTSAHLIRHCEKCRDERPHEWVHGLDLTRATQWMIERKARDNGAIQLDELRELLPQ